MRILLITLILPLFATGQSDWEKADPALFLDLIREYEKSVPVGESYSLETEYRIYNDYSDELPVQSFGGKLICRSGKELNVCQMGHLMIQDESINLTIDTLSKQILLQKPDPSFFYRKTGEDYSTFLEMSEVIYKKTVNGKAVYILELKKGYPYKSMEFTFSEKNTISQIVIYSNQPYFVDTEEFSDAKAKIVMDFGDFKMGKKVDFTQFMKVKDCVLIKGTEVTAVGSYRNFEIIDLRN